MTKVITYGTYDMLHYGHINLLKRAKALGDYLIVGVTAEDFDKTRGKINVKQSLMERIEAVKETGLADEIIIEEYEGQKIDDVQRYDVDIFTVGSDWVGKFDYLKDYCKVVYLDRTEGVSSTEIRSNNRQLSLGLAGDVSFIKKYLKESKFVNGLSVQYCFTNNEKLKKYCRNHDVNIVSSFSELLSNVDAVYIATPPENHYEQILEAINNNKHVICESPISLSFSKSNELLNLARQKNVVLTDGIKVAYSTAYNRLLLLLKTGKIGDIISVDATCTSQNNNPEFLEEKPSCAQWNSIHEWGPIGMLPVLQILGVNYKDVKITSLLSDSDNKNDLFSKIDFTYDRAVATVKVAKGVKSEGELVVSGTKGYVYVPAPWWKMDYFEIRYENQNDNKRYFYHLDGEGIRYELLAFFKAIESGKNNYYINSEITESISSVLEKFEQGNIVILK